MERDTIYTVTIRGRDFLLTKSQIEFDSPNYFTTCFLGDFKESQTRHLLLSRDPDLFLIICDYLCGYKVLPLCDKTIPARMSSALALANLKTDAAFYQLDGLVEQCDALIAGETVQNEPKIRKSYMILGCEYDYYNTFSFEKQMDEAINSSIWRTQVTAEKLNQEPLVGMKRPEAHTGFRGFHTVAAVERFARAALGAEPRLVGWHIVTSPGRANSYSHSLLMVVVLV
ncbi:hypothetical protein FRC11_007482 [Ceratobasidium sp. 423]|nr:hypothetical protein FRC11_007482 [Ceratobasidium sp. 423]